MTGAPERSRGSPPVLRPTDPTEGSRRRILFCTSLGSFLAPFASSAISFSVPEVGHSLDASFVLMVWVPLAFLIPLTSSMVLFGKLSDTFGRTRFFLLGFLVFGAGAWAASLSPSIYALTGFVAVMGGGAALIAVNGTAIVSSVFPADRRGGALGINTMSVYLGLTAGPTVSGLLLGFVGWRSLFYASGGIALVSAVLARRYLRGVELERRPAPLDLVGFASFLAAILTLVLSLSVGEIYGWVRTVPLLATGVLLLGLFVLWERRQAHPLLELTLFTQNRTFAAANVTAFLNYVSTFAIVLLFSIYFTVVAGWSAVATGLILVTQPILMVIVSPVSGRLSDRLGSRGLASLGMLIISAAFFALYFGVGRIPPVQIVWPLAAVGIGFGLFSAPNTNSVMGSVDRAFSGMASGTLGTMRTVGQLMSITVMSALLAAAMPHSELLQLFSGVSSGQSLADPSVFLDGLREAMLLSGLLSLAGVFTSLVRNPTRGATGRIALGQPR